PTTRGYADSNAPSGLSRAFCVLDAQPERLSLFRGRQRLGRTRHQTRVPQHLSRLRKPLKRPTPAQLVNVSEQRRINTQRSELLEQQRGLPPLAERLRGKALDRAIARQKTSGSLGPDTSNTGIAVGAIADKRQIVGNQLRTDTKLGTHTVRIPDGLTLTVDLHDTIRAHTLRKVLVRSPDTNLLDSGIRGSQRCRGSQAIIRLQIRHRPDRDAHGRKSILQGMKLSEQHRIDPVAGLVTAPQIV